MPGSEKQEAPHMGVSTVQQGLPGQEGPLGFLRSRNALKIILDLDESFGLVKGGEKGWKTLNKLVGTSKAS